MASLKALAVVLLLVGVVAALPQKRFKPATKVSEGERLKRVLNKISINQVKRTHASKGLHTRQFDQAQYDLNLQHIATEVIAALQAMSPPMASSDTGSPAAQAWQSGSSSGGAWQSGTAGQAGSGAGQMGSTTTQSFVCNDGTEIQYDYECDGFVDCSDGSDEAGCMNNWICDYTREIPSSKVCDYVSDCDDGSDEFGCEPWMCYDGALIPMEWRCDNYVDCSDGDDEDSCSYDDEEFFYCNDLNPIPKAWRCDYVSDCLYGEDEDDCYNNYCTFGENQRKCNYTNACYNHPDWLCDTYDDCGDGSDEYPNQACPGYLGSMYWKKRSGTSVTKREKHREHKNEGSKKRQYMSSTGGSTGMGQYGSPGSQSGSPSGYYGSSSTGTAHAYGTGTGAGMGSSAGYTSGMGGSGMSGHAGTGMGGYAGTGTGGYAGTGMDGYAGTGMGGYAPLTQEQIIQNAIGRVMEIISNAAWNMTTMGQQGSAAMSGGAYSSCSYDSDCHASMGYSAYCDSSYTCACPATVQDCIPGSMSSQSETSMNSDFVCVDGSYTIPGNWECDGMNDCSDGSDEVGCAKFICMDSSEILANWECDGYADCSDGSDEVGCDYGNSYYTRQLGKILETLKKRGHNRQHKNEKSDNKPHKK